MQHKQSRSLDIVRYLGGSVQNTALEVWWRLEDQLQAQRFLRERGLFNRPVIAFGIGASKGWTRWPFYRELIDLLSKNFDFAPLLHAGPEEKKLAQEILDISEEAVLMDQMPLGGVASVLSH